MKAKMTVKAKMAVAVSAACAGLALHGEFMAGFSRVDVTPPIGTELSGYPRKRVSDGIIDTLDLNAVAFSDGTNRARRQPASSLPCSGHWAPQWHECWLCTAAQDRALHLQTEGCPASAPECWS